MARFGLVGRRRALRRASRAVRNVLAAALGPVLTVGGMALPSGAMAAVGVAGVTAAVAASAVAVAPAARAGTPPGKALVLLQNGESTAPETTALQASSARNHWASSVVVPAGRPFCADGISNMKVSVISAG